VALLALLAVEGRSGLSRDRLIGYLWPDSDGDRARHHLSQSLYVLRQALGPDAIESEGHLIRLNGDLVLADVREFSADLGRGELEAAVGRYSGPFLAGFLLKGSPEFEQWTDAVRQEIASEYARALEALARRAEDSGDPVAAIRWWERLSLHDPYNSRAVVGWMEALTAAGDPGNAIQVARAHERKLLEELGLPPAPEVSELTRRLRERPPAPTDGPGVRALVDEGEAEAPAEAAVPAGDSPPVPPVDRSRARKSRWVTWSIGPLGVALCAALVWYFTGASRGGHAVPFRSVAVIPFMNLTGDPEFDYFADGVADELVAALSRVPDLKVPAQSSSFRFRGDQLDIQAIADSLNVEAVIEGSVRGGSDRVRVNVQIIDAADGYHYWTDTFDRQVNTWMETQAEVAGATIQALDLDLPEGWAPPPSTGVLTAWQDYQKAFHWWLKRTQEGSDTAVVYFRRALEEDSTYARAWAGLANAYITGAIWRFQEPYPVVRDALWEMVDRSLELDPTLIEGVTARAGLLHMDGELEAAERGFLRAIELNPNHALAYQWYADLLGDLERREQAVKEARRGWELDPMSPIAAKIYGDVLRSNMQLEEALRLWDFAIDLAPGHWSGHANKSRALACLGRFEEARAAARQEIETRGEWDHTARTLYLMRDYDSALDMIGRLREDDPAASAELASRVRAELEQWEEALAEYRTAADQAPGDAWTALLLAYIYARMGEHGRARAILADPGVVEDRPSVDWGAAGVYAALGENDLALEYLERAYLGRKSSVMTLAINPRFDPLRGDPRLTEFLARVGLPVVTAR
jgi:TolB-like protein/DNA-binding SARP family transcriptional activator/tetratricopeptide (TPR) repeat protein